MVDEGRVRKKFGCYRPSREDGLCNAEFGWCAMVGDFQGKGGAFLWEDSTERVVFKRDSRDNG